MSWCCTTSPKSLRTGVVVDYRRLIRWRHPGAACCRQRASCRPLRNIRCAGLVSAWVLATAIQQLDEWGERGNKVASELEPERAPVLDQKFANQIEGDVSRVSKRKPAKLELEILETGALEDLDAVQKC